MSTSDDFPWPTPMHPLEFARLLYEKEKELQNQEDSQSTGTKPRACTYLSRKEAAEYLRMSPKTLQNCPKNIPYYKFGNLVLYIKEELDEIIRKNKHGGESCQRLQ